MAVIDKKDFAIGVFDSGVGGLTVARSIKQHLPSERLIYFGDTAHLPYGDKSLDAIRYYSLKICKLLLEHNCKMIVVACNSASSAAYDILLDFFEGKALFVNVVDPLVREAAKLGKKKVGVIATKATIKSDVYRTKLRTMRPDLEIVSLETPLLAPMIEEGFHNNNISKSVIDNYLANPKMSQIDTLLLACTHYPLIRDEINEYYDNEVEILDSTDITAKLVKQILMEESLLCEKPSQKDDFYVSDFTPSFAETTKLFFEEQVELEELPIW